MKIRFIALASLACLSAGCTSINSTSFSNMSSAYREVIETYTNDNILLNIIRSSKNMPMSFLDIPSVIGTGNVLANAGVTSYQAGIPTSVTPATSTTATIGLAVNNSFTFTQASLDNAQFLQSFLKEIPISVLGMKGTERLLPRIVSYTLLIESVELRNRNTVVHRFNNDPLDPNYIEFQNLLYLLIESGLTVENINSKIPVGPILNKNILTRSIDSWGSATVENLAKGILTLDKVGSSDNKYQLMQNVTTQRVCVNKYRAQELLGNMMSPDSYCKDSARYPKSDVGFGNIIKTFVSAYPDAKNLELVIGIRSPANVFDFLGAVLNAQYQGDGSKTVMIKPSKSVFDNYNERYKEPLPLFKVYRNQNISSPAVVVTYKGITYAISDNDDSYSKDVMEFMSTLVTVSKIPGAIPASPAVVVR
jgi:hypothetical protein